MTTPDPCPVCPAGDLIPPGPRRQFSHLENGYYIDLDRCESCGAFWCVSPYEPYLAFEYSVRWMFSVRAWRAAHDLDNGALMRRWHAASIRDLWQRLPPDGQELVEAHRKRSYGHNPVDWQDELNTAELLQRMGLPTRDEAVSDD